MSSFFQRFLRSTRDPRYRVMGRAPFPSFDDYLFALEAAYIARGLSEHPCLPQNGKEFEQARKDFRDRYYPRLEWPDWLAAVLFFGTCQCRLADRCDAVPLGGDCPDRLVRCAGSEGCCRSLAANGSGRPTCSVIFMPAISAASAPSIGSFSSARRACGAARRVKV